MPYNARSLDLPETVARGGLEDPRASHQASFTHRITCRDVTDFISNISEPSPLEPGSSRTSHQGKLSSKNQTKLGEIISRAKEIGKPGAKQKAGQPLSDLVPGLVTTGGLSRSPAFDCLPVISHWAERTDESSAADPAVAVRLSSTWESIHVIGEGATMQSPLGAPCWSLKTHGISPVDARSSKFSQKYIAESKTLVTTVALARRVDTPLTGGVLSAAASLSWMRNTRVADAVDCAVGLLSDAAELLTARNKVLATGTTQHLPFAEVQEVIMPNWCSVRKPLPPKLSGVALSKGSGYNQCPCT